jgi:hypothetical protein
VLRSDLGASAYSRLTLVFFGARAYATVAAGARPLQLRCGHAHHLVGDAIRLMLQWIINGTDFESSLNGTKETRCRKISRYLKPLCTAWGKNWDFAEIPRRLRLWAGYACNIVLVFGRAGLVPGHTRMPRQKSTNLRWDMPLQHNCRELGFG